MAGLRARARRMVKRWFADEPPVNGGMSSNEQQPRIADGALYTMPVSLPEHLDKALTAAGKRDDYLLEASRDSYRFTFDQPYRGYADLPFVPPVEDPLKEWNWPTRRYVLSSCHSVYERNPLANSMLQYTADFVIGTGFNLTCKNKQVQKLLEAFIDDSDNAIREYERQAIINLQLDGELFLRFFEGEQSGQRGQIVAVPMRPWECESIRTESGFFRRPLMYRFQVYETEGDYPGGNINTQFEDIPADEILHVAINRHAYELRGRPELYRVMTWLRADKDFLEDRARQNYWRNALLWLVRVKNATAGSIASVYSRWSKPPTPGSVAVEGDNVEVSPLSNSSGGADAAEDGRQFKNRNIMGLRLPEYYFADGAQANLATATAQSVPALTKFAAFQRTMLEQLWYPLFRRVLTVAIDAGLIDEYCEMQDGEGEPITVSADEAAEYADEDYPLGKPDAEGRCVKLCRVIEAFDVSYAPVTAESKGDLAKALQIAVQMGWISNETATVELGYDPALENKRKEREEDSESEKQAQGKASPDADALMRAMQAEPEDDTEDQETEDKQSEAD